MKLQVRIHRSELGEGAALPRRPSRCYTKVDGPPYTRSEYIHGSPPSKIRIYEMGNPKQNYTLRADLIIQEPCQITDGALEALRIAVNRHLTVRLGRDNYYLKIRPKPHHIIRERRMLAFAGADRLQDGMRLSFGKPTLRAARVRAGQVICSVWAVDSSRAVEAIKRAFYVGGRKLPRPSRVEFVRGEGLPLE
ncbi:MAG: 50S ribosomal protein L16 [Candidatus Freyarchaeota archaeon]|nr:50S ribosomal protein L16 [Candidatus Freyrarchaeum guaymaensis]